MQKHIVALMLAALLVGGTSATPRRALLAAEDRELVAAEEHARLLAELEEIHQLRERMLQEGKPCTYACLCAH